MLLILIGVSAPDHCVLGPTLLMIKMGPQATDPQNQVLDPSTPRQKKKQQS